MKAALYARVSKKDQQTIPEQLAQMREFCERRGWTVAFEFQEATSGSKDTRPERKKLQAIIHKRQVDCVVVWRLDRWGRNFRDLILTLADLHEKGCAFASVTQPIDFTTSTGKLMANMLAALAEFELDQLKERTHLGLARARKAGKKLGRRATPALYRQEVLDFAAEGMKPAAIAAEMNGKVSEATIRRILKDGNRVDQN